MDEKLVICRQADFRTRIQVSARNRHQAFTPRPARVLRFHRKHSQQIKETGVETLFYRRFKRIDTASAGFRLRSMFAELE